MKTLRIGRSRNNERDKQNSTGFLGIIVKRFTVKVGKSIHSGSHLTGRRRFVLRIFTSCQSYRINGVHTRGPNTEEIGLISIRIGFSTDKSAQLITKATSTDENTILNVLPFGSHAKIRNSKLERTIFAIDLLNRNSNRRRITNLNNIIKKIRTIGNREQTAMSLQTHQNPSGKSRSILVGNQTSTKVLKGIHSVIIAGMSKLTKQRNIAQENIRIKTTKSLMEAEIRNRRISNRRFRSSISKTISTTRIVHIILLHVSKIVISTQEISYPRSNIEIPRRNRSNINRTSILSQNGRDRRTSRNTHTIKQATTTDRRKSIIINAVRSSILRITQIISLSKKSMIITNENGNRSRSNRSIINTRIQFESTNNTNITRTNRNRRINSSNKSFITLRRTRTGVIRPNSPLIKLRPLIRSITDTVTHPAVNNRIRSKSRNCDHLKAIHKRANHRLRLNKLTNSTTNTVTSIQMTVMGNISQTGVHSEERRRTPIVGILRNVILIIRRNAIA
nr:MAG TPA: hypothetical protein [Microviridae sp.]